MGFWEGNVNINGIITKVVIEFIEPSPTIRGEWWGNGSVESGISLETYETTIGTILINHIQFDKGLIFFEFQGSGMPKGELADRINSQKLL